MENFAYLLIVLIIVWLIVMGVKDAKHLSPEDSAKQAAEIAQKKKSLARIYWHISEIERISKAKSVAIKSGDMEEYKRLCTEKDNLDKLYKIENPDED